LGYFVGPIQFVMEVRFPPKHAACYLGGAQTDI
jgi:hypothetical protein